MQYENPSSSLGCGLKIANAPVSLLNGKVRQSNHVLVHSIAGYKTERRPGAGEEWLAVPQYHGMEIDLIFINKAKVG